MKEMRITFENVTVELATAQAYEYLLKVVEECNNDRRKNRRGGRFDESVRQLIQLGVAVPICTVCGVRHARWYYGPCASALCSEAVGVKAEDPARYEALRATAARQAEIEAHRDK